MNQLSLSYASTPWRSNNVFSLNGHKKRLPSKLYANSSSESFFYCNASSAVLHLGPHGDACAVCTAFALGQALRPQTWRVRLEIMLQDSPCSSALSFARSVAWDFSNNTSNEISSVSYASMMRFVRARTKCFPGLFGSLGFRCNSSWLLLDAACRSGVETAVASRALVWVTRAATDSRQSCAQQPSTEGSSSTSWPPNVACAHSNTCGRSNLLTPSASFTKIQILRSDSRKLCAVVKCWLGKRRVCGYAHCCKTH